MKKIVKNNFGNFLTILLVFLMVGAWIFSGWPRIWQEPSLPPEIKEARAAFPVLESFTESNTSGNVTQVIVDKPTGTADDDLLVAIMSHDSTAGTLSAPVDWTALFDTVNTGGSTFRAWYKIAGASEPVNYTFTSSDSDQLIAAIMRFTGHDSANPINAVSSVNTGNTNSPTCPSVDTTAADTLVLRAFGTDDDDITVDGGYPSGHTGIFVRGSAGSWGETSIGAAYTTQASAGPTGAASFSSLTANEQWGAVTIAITPTPIAVPITTLGDGIDPGPSTVAPGSSNLYLDQFTFVTDSGTDSVIALTVTTANTTAIASMEIWNEAMTTQYFSTVSSPVGDNWNFSGGTPIPVDTTTAAFRVIFTAQDHAALAVGTYAVTGTVTSFTSTNTQAGTDTDSATITVDNSPPADATWGAITPGDSQIVLNWINPGDSDFYRVLILRRDTLPVDGTPTEGTEYLVDDIIDSSTVRYVGSATTFTDTGLTNGTDYYYKIFSYDTYINYASGVSTGPHTPQVPVVPTITVGTIPDNQVATMDIPSTNNYVGGAFTFVRNTNSTNVTTIVITEAGTVDADANLSNVELYYETAASCSYEGTENLFGTAVSFVSEKATVSGTMSVGTSQVCVYVVLDVGLGAGAGETLEIEISDPSTEVTVSAGDVSPATPVAIPGITNLQVPAVPPASWKADPDAIATAAVEDIIRLRIQVTNTGSDATAYDYLLQYASKVGDFCNDDESFATVPVIDTGEPFEMAVSSYVNDGDPTTADTKLPAPACCTFISGEIVADPSNSSGSFTLQTNKYTEFEFVLRVTATASGTYCFRVTNAGADLNEYSYYPELTITNP